MKTALVTGGAHRIGKAICQTLHAHGFQVMIHYHQSQAAAQALADELNQQRSDSASIIQGDLSDAQTLQSLAEQIEHLDLLVNNASAFYPTPISDITQDAYQLLMDTNLRAPLFLSTHLAEQLAQAQGCIINIVDIHSQRPLKDYPLYSISKAALAMATKTLAKELAPSVRVCGVSPGSILWPENAAELSDVNKQKMLDKIALRKQGCADDIANTVLFLSEADYITGEIISVDGGRTLNQ